MEVCTEAVSVRMQLGQQPLCHKHCSKVMPQDQVSALHSAASMLDSTWGLVQPLLLFTEDGTPSSAGSLPSSRHASSSMHVSSLH